MKYFKNFPDYYAILHIPPSTKTEQIKRAFRNRAKEIHPDTGNNSARSLVTMRELLVAYETLTNENLRMEYDAKYRLAFPSKKFNYREFLSSKRDDPDSIGKLIFFDLLHDHEQEALDLYDSLVQEKNFDLSAHLEREDFMDCAFLLAEKYQEKKKIKAAVNLLKTLVKYESDRPYFRHFFQEILEKLRTLLIKEESLPISEHIELLVQVVNLPIEDRERFVYLKKLSNMCTLYKSTDKGNFFINENRQEVSNIHMANLVNS